VKAEAKLMTTSERKKEKTHLEHLCFQQMAWNLRRRAWATWSITNLEKK
jgi:hypothetical protein